MYKKLISSTLLFCFLNISNAIFGMNQDQTIIVNEVAVGIETGPKGQRTTSWIDAQNGKAIFSNSFDKYKMEFGKTLRIYKDKFTINGIHTTYEIDRKTYPHLEKIVMQQQHQENINLSLAIQSSAYAGGNDTNIPKEIILDITSINEQQQSSQKPNTSQTLKQSTSPTLQSSSSLFTLANGLKTIAGLTFIGALFFLCIFLQKK
jgi:hypothetical protein